MGWQSVLRIDGSKGGHGVAGSHYNASALYMAQVVVEVARSVGRQSPLRLQKLGSWPIGLLRGLPGVWASACVVYVAII